MAETMRKRLTVEAPSRLDVAAAAGAELSRAKAQRLIREGMVTVNGEAARSNRVLKAGDVLEIEIPAPKPVETAAEEIPLSSVYEDKDILVVDKPQGMVVHPSAGHESGTLVNGLLYCVDDLSGVGGELRPGIVHRIDRMTSGLLVVAKNDAAHAALAAQFAAHTAHRSYLAIVHGNLKEDAGTVDVPIGRHPVDRKRMAVVQRGGRRAVTHWRVLERYGAYTLLELRLETGRTHQIRVHMAYKKHPIAGDDVYGGGSNALGLTGQALHGYRLALTHPGSMERMTFYAPIPAYFTAALTRLHSACTAEEWMEKLAGGITIEGKDMEL